MDRQVNRSILCQQDKKMIGNSTIKNITALLIFISVMSGIGALDNAQILNNRVFEYRDYIAPYKSIDRILDNPTKIEAHINPIKKDGVKVLDTLFDFHAVYDIPIQILVDKVLDLGNEQNVFPRMIYTKDLNPADSLWAPHLQEVRTSFKLGRLGQEYHYIFYKIPKLRNDGSFVIKWNLYESIDSKFDFSFGSWYMKEISNDGHNFTYVRNFVHYGIVDYPPYVALISRLAGERDVRGFFKALRTAAE